MIPRTALRGTTDASSAPRLDLKIIRPGLGCCDFSFWGTGPCTRCSAGLLRPRLLHPTPPILLPYDLGPYSVAARDTPGPCSPPLDFSARCCLRVLGLANSAVLRTLEGAPTAPLL
jgi:hypothetical protein